MAMLFGCGFRRSELVGLEVNEIQVRQGHWAVVDLIGKAAFSSHLLTEVKGSPLQSSGTTTPSPNIKICYPSAHFVTR